MLLVATTDLSSPPEEIIHRYKELAEIERLMRAAPNPLCAQSSRPVARVKVGEIGVGDTSTLLATEVTAEQKEVLRELGVPALPCLSPGKM